MTITFDSTFVIANGVSRTAKILNEEGFTLEQNTQTTVRARGEWTVGFPDRASRSIPRRYTVVHPPCASLAAAIAEAVNIPATCPKGGTLVEVYGATTITFAQAWLKNISVTRRGITNQFTYDLVATNPDSTLSPLASMSINNVINRYAITGLSGGGATKLDGETTADLDVGYVLFITPTIGGLVIPKHFKLITDPDPGVTAENTDPDAGPLIVIPDDYNASTNAKIWVDASL